MYVMRDSDRRIQHYKSGRVRTSNKNIDIKFSVHGVFLD